MKSKYDIYDSSVEIGNIFTKLRELSDEISDMHEDENEQNISKLNSKILERSNLSEVFSLKCKGHIKGLDKIMKETDKSDERGHLPYHEDIF